MFRKYLKFLVLIFFCVNFAHASNDNTKDLKQQAFALYETQNFIEASKILENLEIEQKNEEVFLILSNIAQEQGDETLAIQYLNKALSKNYQYYPAYYNLGNIFASKKSYELALNNYELAVRYNKKFSQAYYNLALCQIHLKEYKKAKKNLLQAIKIKPDEKEYYYNLAYCYKKLNKQKQAKRVLEYYNKIS